MRFRVVRRSVLPQYTLGHISEHILRSEYVKKMSSISSSTAMPLYDTITAYDIKVPSLKRGENHKNEVQAYPLDLWIKVMATLAGDKKFMRAVYKDMLYSYAHDLMCREFDDTAVERTAILLDWIGNTIKEIVPDMKKPIMVIIPNRYIYRHMAACDRKNYMAINIKACIPDNNSDTQYTIQLQIHWELIAYLVVETVARIISTGEYDKYGIRPMVMGNYNLVIRERNDYKMEKKYKDYCKNADVFKKRIITDEWYE